MTGSTLSVAIVLNRQTTTGDVLCVQAVWIRTVLELRNLPSLPPTQTQEVVTVIAQACCDPM